jgi:hypothetical protein
LLKLTKISPSKATTSTVVGKKYPESSLQITADSKAQMGLAARKYFRLKLPRHSAAT